MKQYEINGKIYLCDGDKLFVEVARANTDGELVFDKSAPQPSDAHRRTARARTRLDSYREQIKDQVGGYSRRIKP